MKYYDKDNKRIICVGEKATNIYWDSHWDYNDFKKRVESGKNSRFIKKNTEKFLPKGSKILEGGCGIGQYVYGLDSWGYDAYGVDFAHKTVVRTKKYFPELKIKLGDVRELPFENDFFDGYWSLGVIEHFYEGFKPIAMEMKRVLKSGGYLFLTFPYMSPLRKWESKRGKYELFDEKQFEKEKFYQFLLPYTKIIKNFENIGFELIYTKPFDGIKGLKDEVSFIKPILQKFYDSKSFMGKSFKFVLSNIFAPVCGHSILLVFKK